MNDALGDPKTLLLIIGWLITAVMGLVMYTWRKNDAEQDRRIENLERNSASKADIEQRHRENLERLDRIEEGVTGTHRRIDDLYRDLMGKD